jgi:hypothetical protein
MRCQIRVQGHLDPAWSRRFEGFRIRHEEGGTSVLAGALPDQAALQGLLVQLMRLGLPLLSLETSEASPHEEAGDAYSEGGTGEPGGGHA